MPRISWITAACMIDWYGEAAIDVVQQRLNVLEDERARGGSSADLYHWCEIGRAMLELLRGRGTLASYHTDGTKVACPGSP
jgi:hypothetical protein